MAQRIDQSLTCSIVRILTGPLIGFGLGVLVSQLNLASRIDGLRAQIAAVQQQNAPAVPAVELKPGVNDSTKDHHRR